MIELQDDQLVVSFADVHPDAVLRAEFQRTLRIPDDDKNYPLPAGLGRFPLRHVDDFAATVPGRWIEHGGVMFPMYQSEAMWINFFGHYPFAIKIATGKINAVTGEPWRNGLNTDPQDYVVGSLQPWLDGYCVEKGVIRQFVAMPLGSGYSAEEQITGDAEHGGLQLVAYPMKREVFERRVRARHEMRLMDVLASASAKTLSLDMGLAPGGRMRQEIYHDHFGLDAWDTRHSSRCFVHIANSLAWRALTGAEPPTVPLTASEYHQWGVPWFDYYAEGEKAVSGSSLLSRLKSVVQKGKEQGDVPVTDNDSIAVEHVVQLRKDLKKGQVREGTF